MTTEDSKIIDIKVGQKWREKDGEWTIEIKEVLPDMIIFSQDSLIRFGFISNLEAMRESMELVA